SLAFGDGKTAYAGMEAGLMISRDGGGTWAKHRDNLPTSFGDRAFGQVAANRSGDRLYGVVAGDLFRSDDSGRSFQRIAYCGTFAISPSDPRTILAACGRPDECFGAVSLMRSQDGGRSWEPTAGSTNGAIAVDPSNPDIVYAGFPFGGLIRSLD